MNTITTEKETVIVQDYTSAGYGLINSYIKRFTTTDGVDSWNTGRIKTYSFTMNGVESKRYYKRGNAVNAMFKAAK